MKIHIGGVERVFAILLVAYLVASYFAPPGILLLKLAVLFLAAWVSFRIAQSSVQQMLWRLRNRLIIAYFFIAVVPIVLISFLAVLGAQLLGGQLSIYLLTSELERRSNALRSSVQFVSRSPAGLDQTDRYENFASFLRNRYPGLTLHVNDKAGVRTYPEDSGQPPPSEWPSTSGLVLRGNVLHCWARTVDNGRTITAFFPLTREYLGAMVPGLAESDIVFQPLIKSLRRSVLLDQDDSTENRMPPKLNSFDFEISWQSPLSVAVWGKAGSVTAEEVWLSMRTRPSAVLRTVFSQKVDLVNETVPLFFFLLMILFMIAEVIAIVIGFSLTRTITEAVHELYVGTEHVAKGDFSHRIPIEGRDQLSTLTASFNTMAGNMQRLLSIEKERERLQAELEIAREVQNQLYPRTVPALASISLTAVCDPARMVSGDYYDYQQLEPGKVAIAIGDVAGKGISAALLMATVQSSFRTQIRGPLQLAAQAGQALSRVSVSTSKLVSHLNQQLYADTTPEKYATFFLGMYDESTSALTYTNAGHLPPILIRNGEASRLDVNGMVVGAFPIAQYDESVLSLEAKDLLIFFTDGITEPENEYGEMFGEDRLIDLVVKNAHSDENEIIRAITHAVRQWTSSDELQDDMTLLLLRRR